MGPLAFISSFYKESTVSDHHNSPLWKLRRAIYELRHAEEFRIFREANPGSEIAWVAEWCERGLADKPPLEVLDRLVDVLGQSQLYICILAGARRGEDDHGSHISVADQASATSYFEIELYAAAMRGIAPHLFVLDGFSPGPRLESLLRLLSFAIPDWRHPKAMSADAILDHIRRLIRHQLTQPKSPVISLRKRLVREYFGSRAKKGTIGHEIENVLFFDGQFEPRRLPQKDLVEFLLLDFDRVPEMQRKLSRMWLAARELMSASYLPKDVQTDSRLKDFLPLWDKVLRFWTSAASWRGWHGHIYAGTVAPLNSQTVIRMQSQPADLPYGPLASAYYSIANLMPLGIRRVECLRRAARYIEEGIQRSKGQNPGQLAIRGSIRLRFGNPWGAASDFEKMLRLRERSDESEESIGDALVHLGFAELFCGRWRKGRDYLERGVVAVCKNPDHPSAARAKRKLALAYKLTGRFADAKILIQEAQVEAVRLGALDQADR